jgi:hypothetical protein
LYKPEKNYEFSIEFRLLKTSKIDEFFAFENLNFTFWQNFLPGKKSTASTRDVGPW